MSDRETLRQKALRFGFSAVQYVFALVALFLLFGAVMTLFYWIIGEFQDVSLLQASGIFVGMFLFSGFVVFIIEKSSQHLGLKREAPSVSYKESTKQFGLVLLAMVGLVVATHLISQYFAQFPEFISLDLEREILQTIIQANGFLIGFSGIVFGQMFWAINHQQNTIQVRILENPNTDQNILRAYVLALDRKRRSMTLTMSFVIGLFLFSIASSLSGMARTESYTTGLAPTIPDVSIPFIVMVAGVAFLVFSIATSKMSLEEEVKKIREKESQKS